MLLTTEVVTYILFLCNLERKGAYLSGLLLKNETVHKKTRHVGFFTKIAIAMLIARMTFELTVFQI